MRLGLGAAAVVAALLLVVLIDRDRVTHFTLEPSSRIEVRMGTALPSPTGQTLTGRVMLNEDTPERTLASATVTPQGWQGQAPVEFTSTGVEALSSISLVMTGTLRVHERAAPITVRVNLSEPPITNPQGQLVRRVTAQTQIDPALFGGPPMAVPPTFLIHAVLLEAAPP